MTVRRVLWWSVALVTATLVIAASVIGVVRDLDRADMVAGVISALVGLATLVLAAYQLVAERRTSGASPYGQSVSDSTVLGGIQQEAHGREPHVQSVTGTWVGGSVQQVACHVSPDRPPGE